VKKKNNNRQKNFEYYRKGTLTDVGSDSYGTAKLQLLMEVIFQFFLPQPSTCR